MIGESLGPYKILEPLGAGGMGEVYLGEDTRLGRKVAIKVLPEEYARDPDRRSRFEREAKAAAALNHPHIAVVHDIGSSSVDDGDEIYFMVQEYLDGQSLRQRIAAGLAPEEALRLATEIADGLAAAHGSGVVHRDLKPENVFVTAAGHAKILDFGLAKLSEADEARSSLSMSPTALGTVAGQLLGTAAYMAPEQARGENVDQRADIWAFGVLLYEMLVGRRLFQADSVSDTVAAVLRDEIDFTELPADTPPAVRRILARCVERDVRRRLHHIADARIEIEDSVGANAAAQAGSAATPAATGLDRNVAPEGGRARRILPWAIAGLMTVVALIAITMGSTSAPAGRVMRVPVHLSPGPALDTAAGNALAIAPDGSAIAFSAGGELFVRDLDDLEPRRLAITDGVGMPFFSPDGRWIAFFTASELRRVSVDGGDAVTLTAVQQPRGGAWVGGTIVYAPNVATGLWTVADSGGNPRELTRISDEGVRSHRWPAPLGDGRHVLVAIQNAGEPYGNASIGVVDVDSGELRVVHEGGTFPRYSASGHLLFAREATVFALPFDVGAMRATGVATPVVQRILAQTGGEAIDNGSAQYAVADDGTFVYFDAGGSSRDVHMLMVDHDGVEVALDVPAGAYSTPGFSPDGTRIAVDIADQGGSDVWVLDLETGARTRISSSGRSAAPAWSPDGRQLAFADTVDGTNAVYLTAADGSGEARSLTDLGGAGSLSPSSFSPDGNLLAVAGSNVSTGWDWWIVDVASGTRVLGVDSAASEKWPVFSPNGRWIAYESDETGRMEVYVRSLDDNRRWKVSTGGGSGAQWAPDGTALYFRGNERLMQVDVEEGGDAFLARATTELFVDDHVVYGDFPSFAVHPISGDFLFLDRGLDAASRTQDVTLILHFFDLLNR